jgi:hypothetical protein
MDQLRMNWLKSQNTLSLYDAIEAWYETGEEYQRYKNTPTSVQSNDYDPMDFYDTSDVPQYQPVFKRSLHTPISFYGYLEKMKDEILKANIPLEYKKSPPDDRTTFITVSAFKGFLIQHGYPLNIYENHTALTSIKEESISKLMAVCKQAEKAYFDGITPPAPTPKQSLIRWLKQHQNTLKISDANIKDIAALLNPDSHKEGGAPLTMPLQKKPSKVIKSL